MPRRLVFMGTPDFGVPTLRHLAGRGLEIAAVVTQPDKPAGRGYALVPPAVKQAAQALGLPVEQPAGVNTAEFLARLRAWAPDAVVVAAFGQIIKPELLAVPRLGFVNVHASLLPKYRGAAPIQWAIANGETETGITIQRMVPALDAGRILVQERTPVGPQETSADLFPRLADLGGPAVIAALEQLEREGTGAGLEQDERLVTWAPRLQRNDGRIDWRQTARRIHDRVRGFYPWPAAFAFLSGQRLKVLRTRVADEPAPAGLLPGTVIRLDAVHGWLTAAGNGTAVWVEQVQPDNGRAMPAADYARGHVLKPGSGFDHV